ncbi:MAG: heavy metal translocating P-type ATPase, partial [Nitrospirae bacterium]|nr:heavy metal translocating P-type ATPase [Nitrospirota bacterium]
RYLEISAKGRASETVERLIELAPKTAVMVNRNPVTGVIVRETVPVSSLKKGDLVEVKPGEKIPLDGTVIEGKSEADESLLTGESRPVLKESGALVIGGSMNLYGTMIFEVTKTGKDTVLAGIIRAVEDAQARKPKIQALADRVVGIFVPAILIIAFLTVVTYLATGSSIERSLMTGVSVLVIACPCSLGLATPIAVLMFASMASSRGILIRGGEVIENAGRVTRLLFDKTGTITVGRPVLREVIMVDRSCDSDYLVSLASSVECLSEHSIGHAVCGAAVPAFAVSEFRAVPGKGVEGAADGKAIVIGNSLLMREKGIDLTALQSLEQEILESGRQGDTVIYIGWDRRLRAMMVISDVVRDEASEVMHTLKKMNCGVAVVSGDNSATTRAIASRAGIDEALAEASPVGKKDYVAGMQRGGQMVMMVGDGINDAPALTEASVGIAMGRGTDIAMESADAILIRNDLRLIPYFIGLSRKTYSVIRQNIFWAFFYNIVAIPLAVAGLLHPIVAAGAMAASSLFVVGNSLRIRKESRL